MTRQDFANEIALPLWQMHRYLPAEQRMAVIPKYETFNLNDNEYPEQEVVAARLNLGGI